MIFASSLYIENTHTHTYNHNRTALLQSGVSLFPFVFPGPLDLLISAILLKIPVATISRSRLPRRRWSAMVQLLRIPRHLNMRRNFDRREAGASPSLSNGYPRTTDASRACIQRASPFPPSLPPSNDLRFSPTHVNIPRSLQPLSPCLYSLYDPHARAGHTRGSSNVCIAKCVRYWQSGERHFHRKAAVSEAVPFYVLRPIVNTPTRRRRGTFICFSASYARTLPQVPLFEWLGRVLRWPRREPLAAAASSVQKNRRFNIAIRWHAPERSGCDIRCAMSRSADQRTFARASRVLNKAPERHARDPHHFLRDLTILTGTAQTGGNNFTRISLLSRCYFSAFFLCRVYARLLTCMRARTYKSRARVHVCVGI